MAKPTSQNLDVVNGSERLDSGQSPSLSSFVGLELKQHRLDLHLTIQDVSELSGISRGMLSRIENGQATPSLDTLHRVCKTLGISMSNLFKDFDAPEGDASFVPKGKGMDVARRGTKRGHSYELLAYRSLVNPEAAPGADGPEQQLPDYFASAEDITPVQHVDIQAAAQKWIDSSISKTANVPTDFPFDKFKDIYMYAYEKGLKGCTTFRFNPEVFQGVLVKEEDLENTTYRFTLDDGEVVEVKGNEEIEYDGEIHTAANLFDALKEGYYGKF